ncbi:UNVERIFIED_CONTAM: hypothetical protein GTU68_003344 [Idotea baltica]|nr:hypothetical protein [Idotea baltica]
MTEPTRFKASLVEPALKEDATSAQQKEQLPTYNAFSVDGDVTAELVYVNFGVPADYEELARRGIDVKGKIVLAKYYGSWRGIKPKVAAEHGAIGCIIYSDPKDDGYARGDVYPKGAFKNEDGVQRGSVLDMPLYPGDPLTPGIGATKEATRIPLETAPTLTKIPVLPISYGDALPLLKALEGPVAPPNWRGALPITYHIGPGPAKVRLKVEFEWKLTSAYNVIAKLKGSEYPDQWVIRGNHHDAWVNGAADPISGMVALMEEARAVGELVKTGWKPKRTMVYCAWDAEEPGLLGSTEWVEHHADELRLKGVAYINTDGNGRGFVYAGGSHTMEKFFNEVLREVPDPQTGLSVHERARARKIIQASGKARTKAMNQKYLPLNAMGSGSDYTPFIQHLGIASMNIGFGGENSGGEYHSVYDSYDHYRRFKDPEFAYGIALAKTTGRTMLRLANAPVLPFEFQHFTRTVEGYMQEIMTLASQMRKEAVQHNQWLESGWYKAILDPKESINPPKAKKRVPFFNFADLENALTNLKGSSDAFVMAMTNFDPQKIDDESLKELNELLYTAERFLTQTRGLPGRPWYKHQIYAPGFYTGYGVKTFPGVREALEQEKWGRVEQQIPLLAETINEFSHQIDEAASLINRRR